MTQASGRTSCVARAACVARRTRRMAAGLALGSVCVFCTLGCRGKLSTQPPRMLFRDMHDQPSLRPEAQFPGEFGATARRAPPPGVVAREAVITPGVFELGKSKQDYAARVPITVDEPVLARGEERFNIYCSVCHDRAGSGQGVNPQRGFPGPVDLASDNTRNLKDGQIFEIVTQGIRNMPQMGDQIPISDRWPIVAWVRVLQRSQHAQISDVEPKCVSSILPEEPN
jgi:mono/diheme cytochrome c family protein